jgi:ABC-type sugar transport system permease subunit
MSVKTATSRAVAQTSVTTPWWERNLAWLLVAPTLLMFVVFAFLPSLTAILFAFSHIRLHRTGMLRTVIGFDNFRRAFEDPLVQQSAGMTLQWALPVTTVEILLGLG